MDYSFAPDYGLSTTFPADSSLNYFTDFKPVDYSSSFSLGGSTLSPELPTWNIGSGQSTVVTPMDNPAPTPTGNTFNDILSGVSATADGFLNTVGKVYSLKNQWEAQKFGQKVQEAQLDLESTKLTAGIDIAKLNATTQKDLAVAQSQIQVADAQAQVRSSQGASVLTQNAAIPWGLLAVAGAVGLFFLNRRGK